MTAPATAPTNDQTPAPAPTASEQSRAIGGVREGIALARVFSTTDAPADRWIVVAETATGQIKLVAPDANAVQSAQLDGMAAAMSPRRHRRLKARPFVRDLAIPLEPDRLYLSLTLVRRRDGRRSTLGWLDDTSGLGRLLPVTRDEFRGWLSFGNRRHIDAETVCFICRQVLAWNAPRPRDPATPGYVVNALVIYLYKRVEMGLSIAREALEPLMATAASALSDVSPDGDGVRSDQEHLGISLNMALWHLALAQGEGDRAMEVLAAMYDRYRETETAILPVNRGYNVCRSLLMYGVLSLAAGRRETAAEVLIATIEAFKRTVAAVDPAASNLTWFTEMTDTHRAAIHAMTLSRMEMAGEAITPDFLVEMAKAGPRVDTPTFDAATQKVIRALCVRTAAAQA